MSTSLAQAQRAMSLYGLSTFYAFGTVGNFLLISILIQPTHRRNSCSLYLLAATIVNFILIQCILPLSIYSADHVDPQNVSITWCKIRSYLFNGLLMLYRWYKMSACLDRAAMCSPQARIRSFSNVKNACRVIFMVTIIWLLIPTHLAVFFQIESGRCVPQTGAYAKFFSAYSILISGWSPPIVMGTCGFIAYINLKKVRTRIVPLNASTSINAGDSNNPIGGGMLNNHVMTRRDQQLMLLLICEVILYIFTNLLYSINITYMAITSEQQKTIDRIRIEAFISYFSTPFLIIINNCAGFYLYLIVSPKFRQDVKKLIGSCYFCKRTITVQNNQSNVNTLSTIN